MQTISLTRLTNKIGYGERRRLRTLAIRAIEEIVGKSSLDMQERSSSAVVDDETNEAAVGTAVEGVDESELLSLSEAMLLVPESERQGVRTQKLLAVVSYMALAAYLAALVLIGAINTGSSTPDSQGSEVESGE